MGGWKSKQQQDAEDSPQRGLLLCVQKDGCWVGWSAAGDVVFSEGYEPDSISRSLFQMLGPTLKSHVKRAAPKGVSRREYYQQQTENGNGEEESNG